MLVQVVGARLAGFGCWLGTIHVRVQHAQPCLTMAV
jgi:hypothetical protein